VNPEGFKIPERTETAMAEHHIERREDGLYLNGHLLTFIGQNPRTVSHDLDGAILEHCKAKHGDLNEGDKVLLDGQVISIIEWPEPLRVGWRDHYRNDPNSLDLGPEPTGDEDKEGEDESGN
jgi:hypothetical protein